MSAIQKEHFLQYLVWVVACCLIASYLYRIIENDYGWSTTLLWVGSWILMIFYKKQVLEITFRKPQIDFFTWIVLSILALVYIGKLIFLWINPEWLFVHNDESMLSKYALEGVTAGMHQGQWNLLGSYQGTVTRFPALWYNMTGILIFVFGSSFPSAKTLALMCDFGIALSVYYLARRWFGQKLGLIASIIYASMPAVIHFGMSGYQNIQSTLGLMISWVLIDRVFEKDVHVKQKKWLTFCAGLISGLSMYFYLSSVLIPPLLTLWIILFIKKDIISKYYYLREYLIGFLLTSIPFWVYCLTEFNFLTGRSEAIVFSTELRFWISQIRLTIGGLYGLHANGSGIFYAYLPLIPNLFGFILFVIGIIGGLWIRGRYSRITLKLLSVLFATLLFGGVLTNQPPASQRLLHVLPVLVLIMTMALDIVGSFFKGYWRWVVINGMSILLILSFLFAFVTDNIPYYKNIYSFERDFVQWYRSQASRRLPIVGQLPIHMYDMIYFYSMGGIVVLNEQIDVEKLMTLHDNSLYFITTPEDRSWIYYFPSRIKTKLVHTFPNGYELYEITTISE